MSKTNREMLEWLAANTEVANPYIVPDGLARSIWEDKYARRKADGSFETWEERLRQVALGNSLLVSDDYWNEDRGRLDEFAETVRLSVEGVMAYSGRQLQHGDADQPNKILDLFSNCASSPFSFLMLWKSLCGKGVTGDYSSSLRPVNWDLMPNFRLVLDGGSDDSGEVSKGAHPDFLKAAAEFQGSMETLRDAQHKYPSSSEWVRWFTVEDSREGWAQVICALETAAYHEKHKDKLFIFDFSQVRCEGTPIAGHQGRPRLEGRKTLRGLAPRKDDLILWVSAYREGLPNEVFQWDRKSKCEFIAGLFDADGGSGENDHGFSYQISSIRKQLLLDVQTLLKSIGVRSKVTRDREERIGNFGGKLYKTQTTWRMSISQSSSIYLAKQVKFERLLSFADKSAIYNVKSRAGLVTKIEQDGIDESVYCCTVPGRHKIGLAIGIVTGQCGEADLFIGGDDCLVGDVGLHRARTLRDARLAGALMGRSLVRLSSLMPAICQHERQRTNRIGVSAIGILEFFWNHFQLGFDDLISAHDWFIHGEPKMLTGEILSGSLPRVVEAWETFGRIAQAARDGAKHEARRLGVTEPDTVMLLKPGGTVAKVHRAMESANLPGRRYDLRFTQHPKTVVEEIDGARVTVPNPKVQRYEAAGYPVRDISHKYPGYVAVGFPRVLPYIRELDESGNGHLIRTANNVSVDDHYKWLRLLEYHWLGRKPNGEPQDGQIAYTMKYNPRRITFDQFMQQIAENQPTIRCCTFNVCSDDEEVFAETRELIENYGWAPETPITRAEYEELVARIEQQSREDYDPNEGCEAGVCAVDESINEAAN